MLRTGFAAVLMRCNLTAIALVAVGVQATEIDSQRELFKRVYVEVERGNWRAVSELSADDQAQLQQYPLWPDLRATYLRATIENADHAEIEEFLGLHGALKPARELRYRYVLHLAAAGRLDDFLRIYQQYYQGLEVAELDCLALQAEIKAGSTRRIANRALHMWLVAGSQVQECDPVFTWLQAQNLLGSAEYVQRFELAIAAEEFVRARWLARSLSDEYVELASQWLQAQREPDRFVQQHLDSNSDFAAQQQLAFAIRSIALERPDTAAELWQQLHSSWSFTAEQEMHTARHIALWSARYHLPGSYARLVQLPSAAQDDEVARWRARSSLQQENWPQLLTDIETMSKQEASSEEWRYWYNMGLLYIAPHDAASAALRTLAAQRSYYGFLAADALGQPYVFDAIDFASDEPVIADLASRPELIRARELYLVGLDGRGRSEWDAFVAYLTPEQKMQAAKLASRWGWHSRAISTVASVGRDDDLLLRYPLPFGDAFEQFALNAGIPSPWALGVARSESLFMRDVQSSAGAIGLMQLMPATGRLVAAQIQLPYDGRETLVDPQSNIRLGTTYLGQMAQRYGGNRVLATAAYNAGPQRVDRWLPLLGKQDARIWIENIPFNETRNYVRRVLAAETIFYWRLNGEMRRLSSVLPQIESASVLAAL